MDKSLKYWVENNIKLSGFISNLSEDIPIFANHIYIEPTNVCNLKCPFCATNILNRQRGFAEFHMVKKVIDELDQHQLYPRITFSGEGEPFLNKQIVEFVKYAKLKGFNISIINNGTMLTEDLSRELVKSGLNRIQFSIDSINKFEYDSLRVSKIKNKSYYYKAILNILKFIRINYELNGNTFVSISSVQTSLNQNLTSFDDFWNSVGVNNIFYAPLSTLQGNSPMEEAKEKYFVGDIHSKQVCMIPFTNIKINCDGDVNICTHDFHNIYPIGNVCDQSIVEIWNGKKAKKLRRALINAQLDEFDKMGHECTKCNNPLNGYGQSDVKENLHISTSRMLPTFINNQHLSIENILQYKDNIENYLALIESAEKENLDENKLFHEIQQLLKMS